MTSCINVHNNSRPRQLISGQYVCQGAHHGSPIVEIEMIGIPADCAKHKSKVVTRNTVNPIWNEFFNFKVRQ